jgi:Ca2+-binding EF-hand superfamily protein
MAFRSVDKNYDGGLSFKEFIFGLENLGIKLKYEDFRLVFNAIDFDDTREIDFRKFCLLNTDKVKLRHLRKFK